jgi:hypothetical protein
VVAFDSAFRADGGAVPALFPFDDLRLALLFRRLFANSGRLEKLWRSINFSVPI